MKKTARVIITSKCDRKCPGCCNSKLDYTSLDQEGEERANWIDARWCDGMNRDGLPATWTYETEIPCERFDIWEDGEVYCVGLVFSIEDLK